MEEKRKAQPFNEKIFFESNLYRYLKDKSKKNEDLINVGYDLSESKDHAAMSIVRCENDGVTVLSTFQDEEAKLMYNLLNGVCPSIEDVIYMLEKYYSLQDIAIISGKLRRTVLSKAGSKLTVAYLENGSLLRSSNNASS